MNRRHSSRGNVVYQFACCMMMTLLWSGLLSEIPSAMAQALSHQIHELLRSRMELAEAPQKFEIAGELIYSPTILALFYEHRDYRPAWSDDAGPKRLLDDLIFAISLADHEGLRPSDYHLERMKAILSDIRHHRMLKLPFNPDRLADLDMLASDAFLIYGSHLLAGRIHPETIDPEWIANRRESDLAAALQKALDDHCVAAALNDLLPQQPGYARLKSALQKYKTFVDSGGWPVVPKGPKMQKDSYDPRVIALRARLRAEGYLQDQIPERIDRFDETLDESVRRFQSRNGLLEDGVVGRATLEALNVAAADRVRQIMVNLERWRWLPPSFGKRYIIVNIAGFDLAVIENGQEVLAMRVVVGRDYRRTPVFSGKITYLVLNPYWEVPPKIAIEDKIPLIRTDPEYFTKEKIKVLQGWGSKVQEIAPQTVDWSQVTEKNFFYRLRQEPGPSNALGRIKFMFPNKFHVYLHDTPARELFARSERTFSSGCIRVEKPIELAEYLLKEDPNWTRKKILAAIDKRDEQTVLLPEQMPIHLLYCTTWVDENDVVYFRKDIYGRDKILSDALEEIPPDIH